MKRSSQLQPLSRDHHDALRMVLHATRGLSNGTDPGLIAEYISYHFEQVLLPHFKQEEQHILGLLTTREACDPLVQQVLDEHYQMERLAGLISVRSDPLQQHIEQFLALLKAHVKLEENRFFPYVEELLDGERLDQLGEVLAQESRPICPKWEPQFWR